MKYMCTFFFPDASLSLMFYPSTPATAGPAAELHFTFSMERVTRAGLQDNGCEFAVKIKSNIIVLAGLNSVIIGNPITPMREK